MTPLTRWLLRLVTSILLLAAATLWVDPGDVAAQITGLDLGWVAMALALSSLQLVISAWRWRFTAGRLGMTLRFGVAIREYLLAGFLNQVLPGGVLGDVSRAWRHARSSNDTRAAVRAVILERGSGQLVMALIAVPALVSLFGLAPAGWSWSMAAGLAACMLLASPLLPAPAGGASARLAADTRRALFTPLALPVQLISSAAVVTTYLLVFLAAARAVGADLPAATILPLVPPVLLAMLVPVTIAGWGLREGAAAAVWALAGLQPAQGMAIAIAYGALVLAASLPGALFLGPLPAGTKRQR